MKKVISCALAAAMLFSLISCGSKPAASTSTPAASTSTPAASEPAQVEKVSVSFAHNSTEVSPWNQGVEAAIAHLAEQTDGKFEGTSYPNGSLFQSNWEILLEMTQTNSIQVGVEAMSALAAVNPDVNFLCLPFLFENNDQVFKFLNDGGDAWQAIIDSFEEVGIVILGAAPRPMRQISNTKHPVVTMDDLGDLTLRAPGNNLIVAAMEALGIVAVPMSSGEIFSAIQLGTVDGEDNSLAQQYDAKTLEVVDYFTICNYIADGSVMFCSKAFYDSCTAEEQEVLHEMGQIFAETTYGADNDYFKVAESAAADLGVEITYMSAEEQGRCKDACAAVYDDFKTNYDPAVWDALMAAADAAKK